MVEYTHPDPVVRVSEVEEIGRDILVIPNNNVQLVPNIGLIGGSEALLVVDTGMGPGNAQQVLELARECAGGRRLYLTTTHFHPEHAFGAQAFSGEATFLMNRAQADELATKGLGYLEMFRGLGAPVARELEGVELVTPDVIYDNSHTLDLGDRVAHLRATGRAHSRGDQVVVVDDVMFTGDLVETGQFAIFPWFPPHDTDVSGTRWIEVLSQLAATRPTTIVPGHGNIGGPELLDDVRHYLETLRDETWRRHDSQVPPDTIVEEVRAVMLDLHPDWAGQEWIESGVGCLCAELGR
jgi:glyoxylase-like metal-dependent hydrolase (beta-lactamase superfamily II)